MPLSDIEEILGLEIGVVRRRETQESMSLWAVETFGRPGSNLSVAVRSNEEMAELLAKLRDGDDDPEAAIEAADVFIVLMRLFDRLGLDYLEVMDAKMELNRSRKWEKTHTGHGYHVK